jgi:anaerobic ribonucleoside-triphosphate reductase activating protein
MALCYLGGEPLAVWNRLSLYVVSKYFKIKYNDRVCNILYSWRYLEDIKCVNKYTTYMDYGVLGDFQKEKKDLNYIPSSTNQYIYDFKNSKKINSIRKGNQ